MSAEPWESRECFFAKLGLNEKRRAHRRIFRQMLVRSSSSAYRKDKLTPCSERLLLAEP